VQGLRGDSTWARGHSWAVLGFGVAYRESRDRRLLEAARRTADYALGHLPRDGVPFWDYDAAGGDRARDTTAGAALAAGLLELARTDPDPDRRDRYRHAGLRTLSSLAGPRYLARGTGSQAVLRHGHHSPTYPDAGVTYGDYYFLDALLRAQLLPARRPALDAAVRRSAGGGATAALGPPRAVSAVTVRWQDGAASATRFRVLTSRDRRVWTVARTGLSSGRVAGAETYDLPDRVATAVRVQVLGPGRVAAVRVRGRLSPGR
jgi:unsaturated chondroitin disaccharide hydrolase